MALLRVALWHVAAILVFVHGFLLTRVELPHVSSCEDAVPRPAQLRGDACWGHRAFDRAVIVIVDALRYDFLIRDGHNTSYPYAGLMPRTLATARHAVSGAVHHGRPRSRRCGIGALTDCDGCRATRPPWCASWPTPRPSP
jgi:hypothetical protein